MNDEPATIISREEYFKALQGLEIVNLDVCDFSGKVINRARLLAKGDSRRVAMTESSEIASTEDHRVTIHHAYKVTVSNKQDEKPEKLLTLSVTFRVLYSTSEPFSKEFFEIFKKESLRVQVAPYARAWMHDQCLRMGVPPLIMPLVRIQ
jgi:hypothetical protein